MFRILKVLCSFTLILFSYLLVAAINFGYVVRGVIEPLNGDDIFRVFKMLWSPVQLSSFAGIVIGGLLFAYGKNSFRPWFGLIFGAVKNDKLELERMTSVLKTAQTLLIISCLVTCATHLLLALTTLSEGINVTAAIAGGALANLINAGLISLLLILPVKAYWENQSIQDVD